MNDQWRDFKIWSFGYLVGGLAALLAMLVMQALRTP